MKGLKFNLSFSNVAYPHKPTAQDYVGMSWRLKTVTYVELLEHIKQGYSYCHVFKDNKRKKDNFLYAQLITIDVDKSDIPLNEYIQRVALKPTLAYTSFSNRLTDNSPYRFHLVYCFKERIYAEQYGFVYQSLRNLVAPNNDDDCGKNYCQLMNGNSLDSMEEYLSGSMYEISDFIYIDEANINKQHTSSSVNDKTCLSSNDENDKLYRFLQNDSLEEIKITSTQYSSNEHICKKYDCLYDDFKSMSLSKFVYTYREIIPLVIESKLCYNEDGYTVIPDDYESVFNRIRWIDGVCKIIRYKDGEKRRNKLYIDGCVIKKINPDITFEQLLYNLSYRVCFYYDNSDGVLTKKLIEDKARTVMKINVSEMSFENSKRGKITTSQSFCAEHGLKRRSYARTASKIENHKKIKLWYDESKSVAENFEAAKRMGKTISKSTLKRYCSENGIDLTPNHIPVKKWYDHTKSVNDNFAVAMSMGYEVSKSTLYTFCKKEGFSTKGTK